MLLNAVHDQAVAPPDEAVLAADVHLSAGSEQLAMAGSLVKRVREVSVDGVVLGGFVAAVNVHPGDRQDGTVVRATTSCPAVFEQDKSSINKCCALLRRDNDLLSSPSSEVSDLGFTTLRAQRPMSLVYQEPINRGLKGSTHSINNYQYRLRHSHLKFNSSKLVGEN